MVALPESTVASATAAYAFIKTFGYIWGVVIPSIIFNAAFNANLALISSAQLRSQLRDGAAYAYAAELHRSILPRELRDEVIGVYIISLKVIWWTGLGISLASFLLVWIQKELELRTEPGTKHGLESSNTGVQDDSLDAGSSKSA